MGRFGTMMMEVEGDQLKPGFRTREWLPDMDLNHDKQIQSLLCYRYTIGQDGDSRLRMAGKESRREREVCLSGAHLECTAGGRSNYSKARPHPNLLPQGEGEEWIIASRGSYRLTVRTSCAWLSGRKNRILLRRFLINTQLQVGAGDFGQNLNRFQRFDRRDIQNLRGPAEPREKPLKRFSEGRAEITQLKLGVNERVAGITQLKLGFNEKGNC